MKKKYNGMLYLGSLFMCFVFSNSLKAQITFEEHYNKTYDQSGKDVLEVSDGYLIPGTTENTTTNDLDLTISKTDLDGNFQWQKSYGGPRPEYPNSIIKTSDGNYFVVGYTQSTGSDWDMDMYLLKIKPNGDTLFSRVYGGTGNEEAKEIIETSDGNYLIVGASNSNSSGFATSNNQIQLIKINLNGSVIWSKYYGDANYQSARSVTLCPDNGFIIAGKSAASPTSIAKAFIIKTDIDGDSVWTKIYSGPNSYEGKSIIANSDGTYVLAVDDSSATFDSDVRIMKWSNDGNTILWNIMFGGTDKDIVKVIQSTNDGGYIIGAISRSFGWGSPDMWIIKLNSGGTKTWENHFGGGGHEHCYNVRQTSDNGYIAVGHARSFDQGLWEIYLVKLDQNGTVGIEELAADNKFTIYPNPSNGVLNIDLTGSSNFKTFTISNSLGQAVFSEDLESLRGNQIMTIDMKDKAPGIYFVTLQSATTSITKKLILN